MDLEGEEKIFAGLTSVDPIQHFSMYYLFIFKFWLNTVKQPVPPNQVVDNPCCRHPCR